MTCRSVLRFLHLQYEPVNERPWARISAGVCPHRSFLECRQTDSFVRTLEPRRFDILRAHNKTCVYTMNNYTYYRKLNSAGDNIVEPLFLITKVSAELSDQPITYIILGLLIILLWRFFLFLYVTTLRTPTCYVGHLSNYNFYPRLATKVSSRCSIALCQMLGKLCKTVLHIVLFFIPK